MLVYKYRQDMVYDCEVELEDSPAIPKFHTFQAPPAQDGYYAVMSQEGWKLVQGEAPEWPPVVPEFIIQANLTVAVREERNKLLASTDWTQGKDISDSVSDQYAIYRQALRDLPTQPGFPNNVIWPTI